MSILFLFSQSSSLLLSPSAPTVDLTQSLKASYLSAVVAAASKAASKLHKVVQQQQAAALVLGARATTE